MTYLAIVFFYFVTCPCSSRTKRHDNLFVDDDDDDSSRRVMK